MILHYNLPKQDRLHATNCSDKLRDSTLIKNNSPEFEVCCRFMLLNIHSVKSNSVSLFWIPAGTSRYPVPSIVCNRKDTK